MLNDLPVLVQSEDVDASSIGPTRPHLMAVQRQRYGADNNRLNSRMMTRQLRKHCGLDAEGKKLLQVAMDDLGLSARAHDRILRVARTIADLEGSPDIKSEHLVEAIGYRSLDRTLWAR